MSLRETSSNSIHITDPWKAIEVKTHTIILRDDMEVGTSNHIQVFYPGEDLSSAPTDVQAIATSLWTEALIQAFNSQTAVQPVPDIPEDQANLGLLTTQEIVVEEEEAVPFET